MCYSFTGVGQTKYGLNKALQTAKLNNPYLRTQQFNVDISMADTITAHLRPNPILNNQSLQLINSTHYYPYASSASPKSRQIWWQLTKPFILPAHKQNKINYARQSVVLEEKKFAEIERNLLMDVASNWLDIWTSRKQIDVLISAKSNLDTMVATNRLRLKNQVITETELMRTELLSSQYAVRISSAEQAYKNQLANLKVLMGVTEDFTIDTSEVLNYAFTSNLDSLIQIALNQRSDLQSIQSSIQVAEAGIKLQKTQALPTPELGMIVNPQNTIPYVGFFGTIVLPIFSRNQGEIQKATVVKLQAQQELETSKVRAQTEIVNTYNMYKAQEANIVNYKKYLLQSETILTNVRYAYVTGGTTIIDYLEAQRSWIDTQQNYYETLQLYKQSYIQLLYSTGIINKIAQ